MNAENVYLHVDLPQDFQTNVNYSTYNEFKKYLLI
jgi:hypothetical protein